MLSSKSLKMSANGSVDQRSLISSQKFSKAASRRTLSQMTVDVKSGNSRFSSRQRTRGYLEKRSQKNDQKSLKLKYTRNSESLNNPRYAAEKAESQVPGLLFGSRGFKMMPPPIAHS